MGRYLHKQGLFDHYDEKSITDLANHGRWPDSWNQTQIDAGIETNINTCINNAETTINGYVGTVYEVSSLSASIEQLPLWTADLAKCELAKVNSETYLNPDGAFYSLRKGVIDQLKAVKAGNVKLTGATEKTGGQDLVEHTSPEPKYGRGGMSRY